MGAIIRRDGKVITVTPTAKIEAGTVVKIGTGLIGVAPSTIEANATGELNAEGEYDVDITAGTAYAVGDLVQCAGKTLSGSNATVTFGPALEACANTATVIRARLVADKRKGVTDSTGGTAQTSLVAPASSSYTADELKKNFATIAAILNQ